MIRKRTLIIKYFDTPFRTILNSTPVLYKFKHHITMILIKREGVHKHCQVWILFIFRPEAKISKIPENGKIPTYSNYLFYFFHLMIRNWQTTNTVVSF